MIGNKNRLALGAALGIALLLVSPASLWAQSAESQAESLSKSDVAAMGHLVIKAAHFTAQEPRLIRYEVANPKTFRATYTLTMEYYGILSGKRYVATIDIHMDTLGNNEAMRVDYSDNNPYFSANASKLNRVVHQINNVLGVP
jgi:hypothetical protein